VTGFVKAYKGGDKAVKDRFREKTVKQWGAEIKSREVT